MPADSAEMRLHGRGSFWRFWDEWESLNRKGIREIYMERELYEQAWNKSGYIRIVI